MPSALPICSVPALVNFDAVDRQTAFADLVAGRPCRQPHVRPSPEARHGLGTRVGVAPGLVREVVHPVPVGTAGQNGHPKVERLVERRNVLVLRARPRVADESAVSERIAELACALRGNSRHVCSFGRENVELTKLPKGLARAEPVPERDPNAALDPHRDRGRRPVDAEVVYRRRVRNNVVYLGRANAQ